MARNKTDVGAKFNAPFPTRLRTLMDSKGETQESVAKAADKTRQTISQYVNGISEPGYDTLVKIADYFDVSTDYLLGRTDDPNRHPSAMDELGLSADALSHIRVCHNRGKIDGLNVLLGNFRFADLAVEIDNFYHNIANNIYISQSYKENTPVKEGIREDYYKVRRTIDEEALMDKLTKQIEAQNPGLRGNISLFIGSYAVESQKRHIVDSFDEILRHVSRYDEFREDVFRLNDFFFAKEQNP
jgi:transcriptional regulator with XRE-family HTH domain